MSRPSPELSSAHTVMGSRLSVIMSTKTNAKNLFILSQILSPLFKLEKYKYILI
jgi:hypothetical protein